MVRSKLPGRLRAAAGWVLAIAVVLGAGRGAWAACRAGAYGQYLRGDRQDRG